MKILIDMNLSPAWVSVLEEAGHTASHWSTIGSLNAPDRDVLFWAKANGYVLFTFFDEQPCAEANSEEVDFRAASEFFAAVSRPLNLTKKN